MLKTSKCLNIDYRNIVYCLKHRSNERPNVKKIYNLIFIISFFLIAGNPGTKLSGIPANRREAAQAAQDNGRLAIILADLNHINQELTRNEKKKFYKEIQKLVEQTRKSHEKNKVKLIKKLGKKLAFGIGLSISTIITITIVALVLEETVGPGAFFVSWAIITYIVYEITYGFYALKEYIKYSFKTFIAPFKFVFKATTLPLKLIYNLYDYLITENE